MTTFDMSDLLKFSDITTAGTSSLISYVYGQQPTARRATEGVLISVLSRIISQNFPKLTGGEKATAQTKNQIVVGILNALLASGMNRSVAKSVVQGISSDLLAEQAFKMMQIEDKTLFGTSST